MTGTDDGLLEGLYERLITRELQDRLTTVDDRQVDRGPVDDADAPEVLARHLRNVAVRAFREERNVDKRLALVNELIARLGAPQDHLPGTNQLLSIFRPPKPGRPGRQFTERPSTPLSDAALLTNAHGEPGMGHEVRAELASADRVDVIMAFVKW